MNPSARYEDHARRLHRAAKDEHQRWLATLTAEERRFAEDVGLAESPEDNCEVGGHSPYSVSDLADTPLAKLEIDFAGMIDTAEETLAELFEVPIEIARKILTWHQQSLRKSIRRSESQFLHVIIGGLLSAKNPKLSAVGLAFAAGLDALNGLGSQRQYARQHGISPAAVSKVVKAWSRDLNLGPNAHQKSDAACETYSAVGKARHWRKQRCTSGIARRLLSKIKTNPRNN
jgi:hypothetical protein